MYAIIVTGGKQYRVSQGDVIYVEKLNVEEGQEIIFDQVIAFSDETIKIGTPIVEGVTVRGSIVKNGKNKKITVFTYKAKKNVHRKLGHRQPYTKVQIEEISSK